MEPEDLRIWLERSSRLSAEFARGFEARFGYPPGENRVFVADGDDSGDLEELAKLGAPAELLDFFVHVREVSLPDLGNGVFVHSARHVLTGLLGALPTRLVGVAEERITVLGSDGGGSLFALSAGGGQVYRLRGGAFLDGAYEAGHQGTTVVANDLREFLDGILRELERQVAV
ncbi:hypothetical protein ACIBCH_23980 [Amycolatopsis thailandensis]|uniref:hypothetical protein n=1 Tax=Amycolatopsis thailandensis TaxID=589330 RepID=UPI003793B64F